jgi:hypothetical protein
MTKSIDIFSATNPAFCSLVLLSFCEGYQDEAKDGVPYSLMVFPIPIILSGDLSETFINTNIKTGFYSWVKNNPHLLLNLDERIEESFHYIKSAIEFGFGKKIFELNENGSFSALSENMGNYQNAADVAIYFKNAKRLGAWLGQIKSPKTIYNHLGLQI